MSWSAELSNRDIMRCRRSVSLARWCWAATRLERWLLPSLCHNGKRPVVLCRLAWRPEGDGTRTRYFRPRSLFLHNRPSAGTAAMDGMQGLLGKVRLASGPAPGTGGGGTVLPERGTAGQVAGPCLEDSRQAGASLSCSASIIFKAQNTAQLSTQPPSIPSGILISFDAMEVPDPHHLWPRSTTACSFPRNLAESPGLTTRATTKTRRPRPRPRPVNQPAAQAE
jgi:hypothetical protein